MGIAPAIEYIRRQQIKWFGHVTRQNQLNIVNAAVNKRYDKVRPVGRPRTRWTCNIKKSLGNITMEEANKRAQNRKLFLPSTLNGK